MDAIAETPIRGTNLLETVLRLRREGAAGVLRVHPAGGTPGRFLLTRGRLLASDPPPAPGVAPGAVGVVLARFLATRDGTFSFTPATTPTPPASGKLVPVDPAVAVFRSFEREDVLDEQAPHLAHRWNCPMRPTPLLKELGAPFAAAFPGEVLSGRLASGVTLQQLNDEGHDAIALLVQVYALYRTGCLRFEEETPEDDPWIGVEDYPEVAARVMPRLGKPPLPAPGSVPGHQGDEDVPGLRFDVGGGEGEGDYFLDLDALDSDGSKAVAPTSPSPPLSPRPPAAAPPPGPRTSAATLPGTPQRETPPCAPQSTAAEREGAAREMAGAGPLGQPPGGPSPPPPATLAPPASPAPPLSASAAIRPAAPPAPGHRAAAPPASPAASPEGASPGPPPPADTASVLTELGAWVRQRLPLLGPDCNYYRLLGVPPGADVAEIRKVHREMVIRFHPDRFARYDLGPMARQLQEVWEWINKGFAVLVSPEKRKEYDIFLDRKAKGLPTDVNAVIEAEAQFREGERFLNARRWAEAAARFERAVALNAAEAEFRACLAWARFQAAVAEAARSSSAGPVALTLRYEVKKMLEQALKDNPKLDRAHLYLGFLYKYEREMRAAAEQFEKALQVNPYNVDAKRELRMLAERARQAKEQEKGGLLDRLKRR